MAKIKVSFSGHDKFDCKIDWLSRGLSFYNSEEKSKIEYSVEKLGLGINMIKSLNHWMKILGLMKENKLSELAIKILKYDIYLENIDVLWILHWNLVKNREKATLYNRFFNNIYLYKFTKNDLFEKISQWLVQENIKLSVNTIKSDIDVFLRMYNNSKENSLSLFTDLNIVTNSKDFFILNIGYVATISDIAFLYILNDYIQSFKKNSDTISIDDLQKGEVSIQKILCMNENLFFMKIHNLSKITNGKMSYLESSGARQIYIKEPLDNQYILEEILKAKY